MPWYTRLWAGIRKAAGVLVRLNDAGVVDVNETDKIRDTVNILDEEVRRKENNDAS